MIHDTFGVFHVSNLHAIWAFSVKFASCSSTYATHPIICVVSCSHFVWLQSIMSAAICNSAKRFSTIFASFWCISSRSMISQIQTNHAFVLSIFITIKNTSNDRSIKTKTDTNTHYDTIHNTNNNLRLSRKSLKFNTDYHIFNNNYSIIRDYHIQIRLINDVICCILLKVLLNVYYLVLKVYC